MSRLLAWFVFSLSVLVVLPTDAWVVPPPSLAKSNSRAMIFSSKDDNRATTTELKMSLTLFGSQGSRLVLLVLIFSRLICRKELKIMTVSQLQVGLRHVNRTYFSQIKTVTVQIYSYKYSTKIGHLFSIFSNVTVLQLRPSTTHGILDRP